MPQHTRPLDLENRARRVAAERPPDPPWIEPGALRQHQGLGDQLVCRHHDELVAGLGDLADSDRSAVDDDLAGALEDCSRPVEVVCGPADDDRELACFCTEDPTAGVSTRTRPVQSPRTIPWSPSTTVKTASASGTG